MREIALRGTGAAGKTALVDDEDYELVSQYKWYLASDTSVHRSNYARTITSRRGKNLTMHKLITGFAMTDHINGDGLDNRRSNLREASNRQNQCNRRKMLRRTSSRYKGVSWCRRTGNWQVAIRIGTRNQKFLGRYANEEEAARVYDDAARKYQGEFARLNFPVGSELSS